MRKPEDVQFGQLGSDFATGAGASITIPTDRVVIAITALEATKLDATNTTVESGFDKPTAAVYIPQGCTVFGRFTGVELDEGSIMAYFGQ
jgi:hypothetical protein